MLLSRDDYGHLPISEFRHKRESLRVLGDIDNSVVDALAIKGTGGGCIGRRRVWNRR